MHCTHETEITHKDVHNIKIHLYNYTYIDILLYRNLPITYLRV